MARILNEQDDKDVIFLKSPEQIQIMRQAGRLVAEAHVIVREHIRPGICTAEINQVVEDFIYSRGCKPSFKGYHGFPFSTCICVNEEMVHGFPSQYQLKDGDLVSIDIGIIYNGYHGDSVWTYGVGNLSSEAKRLLEVGEQTLMAGIQMARRGRSVGDIGYYMERTAKKAGFSTSHDYGGHGVGEQLHEAPFVPNYGRLASGVKLKKGMIIAIEPTVCAGSAESHVLENKWTAVTNDGSLAVQFEHTVGITLGAPIILTTL